MPLLQARQPVPRLRRRRSQGRRRRERLRRRRIAAPLLQHRAQPVQRLQGLLLRSATDGERAAVLADRQVPQPHRVVLGGVDGAGLGEPPVQVGGLGGDGQQAESAVGAVEITVSQGRHHLVGVGERSGQDHHQPSAVAAHPVGDQPGDPGAPGAQTSGAPAPRGGAVRLHPRTVCGTSNRSRGNARNQRRPAVRQQDIGAGRTGRGHEPWAPRRGATHLCLEQVGLVVRWVRHRTCRRPPLPASGRRCVREPVRVGPPSPAPPGAGPVR